MATLLPKPVDPEEAAAKQNSATKTEGIFFPGSDLDEVAKHFIGNTHR